MVSIALWPFLLGRPVIRSMVIYENSLAFGGDMIWNIRVLRQCMKFLFCWQVAHPLMYWSTQVCALGQK